MTKVINGKNYHLFGSYRSKEYAKKGAELARKYGYISVRILKGTNSGDTLTVNGKRIMAYNVYVYGNKKHAINRY